MEYKEFKGKTVEEALTVAAAELVATSAELDYEVIEKGSTGFLGIGSKPAVIRARKKDTFLDDINTYLHDLFKAMELEAKCEVEFNKEDGTMNIEVSGPEMSVIIGKRGQTLDALQYLISLFVNKESDEYIRVKLDTENYRERRKATLEKLAKKIAYSVKRNRKSIALEPMNPYERRVIHSALQNDRYVCTKSEGEEPYRKVVVMLKKENK